MFKCNEKESCKANPALSQCLLLLCDVWKKTLGLSKRPAVGVMIFNPFVVPLGHGCVRPPLVLKYGSNSVIIRQL